MWNTISQHLQGVATPQAAPQQAPAQPQAAPPPPQAAPQAPPQGGLPSAGGAPPPPPQGGGEGDGAVVARALVTRAKTLSPQESQIFFDGITVPALQVLKKILPEIAPAIDGAIAKKQGGGAPGAPAQGAAPPQAVPQAPPPSGLRQIA